ncbi:hypothetical protein DOTSEDRAFT_69360 [Dothistroma septosporum NZE10]|uniref:Uncharacterized protein n=1 Tax=Dothistroma septosporum (strain NZE10 / CBS 128990) TaxID=675120 RepID=N1PV94_DOTSN|nr:hypothetical protein DOTSEDRAFT_69360 [Dothistroma septosporum NZE10]
MATMAFPSLSLPQLDDNMEVSSSPAGNTLDDDIEIDFDDYTYNNGGAQVKDDEHMLEDGDPVRPPTATDEMMDDDEHINMAPNNEEVMQDSDEAGHFDLADEELIDYDDDDDFQYQDQAPLADTVFGATKPTVQDTAAVASVPVASQPQTIEPAEEEIVRQPQTEVKPQEVLLEKITAPGAEGTAQAHSSALLATEGSAQQPAQQAAHVISEEASVIAVGEASGSNQKLYMAEDESKVPEAVGEGKEDDAEPSATFEEEGEEADRTENLSPKPPPQLRDTLDTTTHQGSEGPPTPTDTGLHPMIVRYGEHAMPLFKSHAQPEGLLKNDNLANVSLSDLITSCRERLSVKTGQAVADTQNLVIGFDSMGLVLVEGSPSASETSLGDVLDVYLLLHRNDGHDDVPPLSMTLTVQFKFTSHLQMIKQAAFQGQGMSSFAGPQLQGVEDYYDEEAEENEPHEDNHDEEQTLVEEVNGENEDRSDSQARVQDLTQDPAEAEHENYEENYEYAGAGEYAGQQKGQEYNEDTNYAEYDEHAEYPDPEEDVEEAAENGTLAAEADQSLTAAHDVNVETDNAAPDSATDPMAVRDGHANDATDTPAEEGPDELAPLTEGQGHEAEEHDLSYEADADFGEVTAVAHREGDQASVTDEKAAEDELDPNLVSENPYSADLAYPEPEDDGEQQYGEAEKELAEHEESHTDQVDNGDEGECQPQGADDQFHTAFDLLDGEGPEHGPGNKAPWDAHDQLVEHEEDNIVFDDDDEDVPAEVVASNSPLGKRSFEEHADDDLFDFGDEEPDLKKPRSGLSPHSS